jgi:DNA-binding GntR family transcriptional regulator
MSNTPLPAQIASMIIGFIRDQKLRGGDHLPAQQLADTFRVSRSPVNKALEFLERHRIVRREANRGFFLIVDPVAIPTDLEVATRVEEGEEVYFQVADDRLSGLLPDRVSENEVMRRYSLSRGETVKMFNRMAREGWVAKLPGKGWTFLPTLDSGTAYQLAYLFRIAIEPAAILQPSFKINRSAFRHARQQQQALLDGAYLTLSRAELFHINSGFHEMIVECSNNIYFIEAIKRVNTSRRLAEYRKTLDRSRLVGQCLEHIHILDLLEAKDYSKAAEFLKFHLEFALKLKTDSQLP